MLPNCNWARRGSPAQDPVEIDYTMSEDLETRKGTASDVAIHAGSAEVHVNGNFQFTQQAIMLDLHLNSPNLPIDQIERLLPVVGVHLPSGSSLQGGTLTANISVTGPATTATLAGPVEIDHTKLAGFDLGSKIQGLNPLAGTSGGTDIEVLKANVSSSPDGAHITDIYGNIPRDRLCDRRRNGSAVERYQLQPECKSEWRRGQQPLIQLLVSLLSQSRPPQPRAIPLTITGTATNPSIKANSGAKPK